MYRYIEDSFGGWCYRCALWRYCGLLGLLVTPPITHGRPYYRTLVKSDRQRNSIRHESTFIWCCEFSLAQKLLRGVVEGVLFVVESHFFLLSLCLQPVCVCTECSPFFLLVK